MNRKNLTAAVLAGLAGAAGIAGTAQAVNLNPDGLGQVLIYPYYSAVEGTGNVTLLSVVNTTDAAKAVKVRFKEGYNSREVLDFNMYMSAYDVWVAAIQDNGGTPTLYIPDTTCTVPYLYAQDSDDDGIGEQEFLPYDYQGNRADGGPTDIQRAAEGYFEMIEMGTLVGDSAYYATHSIDADGVQAPNDCDALVDAWTRNPDGYWIDDQSWDITRNSGGLFGGGAIINNAKGTMYSYDARAIQGFDKSDDGHLHAEPGSSEPSLDSGDQNSATIFFGVPKDEAVTLNYVRSVDAVSAVFMHQYTMNEYTIETGINAASEWVMTFPTKNWYVDEATINPDGSDTMWIPDVDDEIGCNGWDPGEDFAEWSGTGDKPEGWEQCNYIEIDVPDAPISPFTSVFDGEACEGFGIEIWDREENAGEGANNPHPPIVSPPPPGGSTPEAPNEICYEVNVLRFGNDGVFVPVFDTSSALLKEVDTGGVPYDNGTESKAKVSGWARIDWSTDPYHIDWEGLVGLPVTGFWAMQITNGFLGTPEASVLANYGGLFSHKGNVKRITPPYDDRDNENYDCDDLFPDDWCNY